MDTLDKRAVWPGWETVRLIGQGSFGAVYEIRRNVYGSVERAALKHIAIPQNASDLQELRANGRFHGMSPAYGILAQLVRRIRLHRSPQGIIAYRQLRTG